MHWLFWVMCAVFFGVAYRLGYKLVSDKFPALLSVSLIMFIVSVISFGMFFLFPESNALPLSGNLRHYWPLVVVGFFVAGLEVSVMMIYRSGGPLSIAQSLSANIGAIAVFIIGAMVFREHTNVGQTVGFLLGLIGVTLMAYYSRKRE